MTEDNGYWAKDGTWVCRLCKREHFRRYRQDPQFRAMQAAASRRYIAADPARAKRIGVGQRQVSKIEHGDLDSAKVGTIRSYLEAVGGGLALEYVTGDQRIQVA